MGDFLDRIKYGQRGIYQGGESPNGLSSVKKSMHFSVLETVLASGSPSSLADAGRTRVGGGPSDATLLVASDKTVNHYSCYFMTLTYIHASVIASVVGG